MRGLFLCALALSAVSTAWGKRYNTKAGPVDDKVNVFIVPHTHDDVGWLKTVDEYFMGANRTIQHAGVQYILDSVTDALLANPDRKFIYVEQAFFTRWWRELPADRQAVFKTLVANGQMEFANGGWCMHDEAATHYVAMIDQTTVGHTFLKETFGAVPKTGWQIDPFGHSATNAALLSAEVGFESLWFMRIDYGDKAKREADKTMQYVWQASESLGPDASLLTGALITGYGPPRGFCFDRSCDDATPIQDDPNLEDNNVKYMVDLFVNRTLTDAAVSATPNVMFLMGSDFNHEQSDEWYKNLDKLIHYVNEDGRVNAFYAHPSDFANALMNSSHKFSVKTDDLFPYGDDPHGFWTGYFTSRPALKRYVRIGSSFLQSARKLDSLAGGDGTGFTRAEESMGVVQHHDAVSGTSKQHVAFDYAKRIAWSIGDGSKKISDALNKLTAKSDAVPTTLYSQCPLANVSMCDATSNPPFVVAAFNPLAAPRTEMLTIPVTTQALKVVDSAGAEIPSQVVPSPSEDVTLGGHPYHLLVSVNMTSMGLTTVFVEPSTEGEASSVVEDGPTSISNEHLTAHFDPKTGRLSALSSKTAGHTISLDQNWLWYNSSAFGGDQNPKWGNEGCGKDTNQDHCFQNSGAYIFRPNQTEAFVVSNTVTSTSVSGALVQEVHQTFSDWLSQTVRLYSNQDFLEIEYTVGPIPIGDDFGKEIITRFSTNISSAEYLYTDSNGREMQQRLKDFRPTWTLNKTEPVSENYYPVNAAAFIKDHATATGPQLTVLTDRSQGGASLADGQIELMVHRRLLYDDHRGVGEPLNETTSITPYPNPVRLGTGLVIRGVHRLALSSVSNGAAAFRPLMDRIFSEPTVSFAPGSSAAYLKDHKPALTGAANLPENVAVVTLKSTGAKSLLLRLGHQFAVGEDATLSKPATVELGSLFTGLKVSVVKEVSLTANQPVTAVMNRKRAQTVDAPAAVPGAGMFRDPPAGKAMSITLGPMQIRTFEVTLE